QIAPRVMCGWPPARKDFSAYLDLKVTCGHVSGLLARREAAGPDGFRGSRSDQARGVALPHVPVQVCLDPSVDRRCHHAVSPRKLPLEPAPTAQVAAGLARNSS